MRRILLALFIALFALTLSGAAFADEEKTVEKNIALSITLAGDEAVTVDCVHAAMLINALRALGGKIELDGDRLMLKLELGPEQLDALRTVLAGRTECSYVWAIKEFHLPQMEYEGMFLHAKKGSYERFLLGKRHEMPTDGEKRKIMIMQRGDAPKGKGIAIHEGCCKVVVTCPKCGEHFKIDLPMPEMPDMPMPSGEHPKMFMFRMHPDGEFAPPHPPMPDMDAMRERMGPMMERMERMHHEFGEVNRRCAELERALHELRVEFNRRPVEQDREMWRAIEELHRMFEDRDRERDREFDELWRALDELYEVLEDLERELE